MTLSADPEIHRILREPEGDTPQDHLELLSVLSNRITPAGIPCPPPTLGTYALLNSIHSPFLGHSGGKVRREDAAAALFILSRPKQAAELLLRRAVCEEQFGSAAECCETDPDPETVRETLAAERDFRKEWERRLRRFDRRLGSGERALRRATDELARHLNPGIGFSMLPESDDGNPQAFNLETVARIAAGLADVMPGISTFRLLWQIPMTMIGMMLVQSARKHGMQGISRDEKTRRLWQRFQELQNPDGKTKRQTASRHRGKMAAKARRHYRRIRKAADLRLPAAGTGIRGKSGNGIRNSSAGNNPAAEKNSIRDHSCVRRFSRQAKTIIGNSAVKENSAVRSSSVEDHSSINNSFKNERIVVGNSAVKTDRTVIDRNRAVSVSREKPTGNRSIPAALPAPRQETSRHAGPTGQERITGISRNINVTADRRIPDRRPWLKQTDFAAVILPTGPGPLQTLATSVTNIETLLKRQLPDSVV